MSTNEELIKIAAMKEGFSLQGETYKIFNLHDFKVQEELTLSPGFNVDVFAYPISKNRNTIYIVQCKGSSDKQPLLLFENSQQIIDQNPKHFKQTVAYTPFEQLKYDEQNGFRYHKTDPINEAIQILISKTNQPDFCITLRHCFTGDFRSLQNKGDQPFYKKTPKEDYSNNLFKGITQTTLAVNYSQKEIQRILNHLQTSSLRIMPLIVTNATIYIVDPHDGDDMKPIEQPWAIHTCTHLAEINNPANIQYLFIANIKHLEKFINKFTC